MVPSVGRGNVSQRSEVATSEESLAQKVRQLAEEQIDAITRTERLMGYLSSFRAEALPPPSQCGLDEWTWLRVYWVKLGKERGVILSRVEQSRMIPEHLSLSTKVRALFSARLGNEATLNRVEELLSSYSSENLPMPLTCGLSQATWLHIYWEKLGKERGKPLSQEEKSYHIPVDSADFCLIHDPLADYVMSFMRGDF